MATNNVINNAFLSDYTGLNKVSRNLIIGGDFGVNPWQRGTTFTGLATASYSADRFRSDFVSTQVSNISRSTNVPTVAATNYYTNNSFLMTVTTADAAIAAGDYYNITQRVEGYNFAEVAQRPFTLSFWVKAVKTGIYCVSFVNGGSDRSYVAEYTINTTATWEKKTVKVTASPSAGTWDYTTGIGLSVSWALACGSTFQTSANAWQTGNYFGTSNQVNALDSNTNTFQLALIQLEAGSVATPFEQKTIKNVLSACQRYYFKTFAQGTDPIQNLGSNVNAAGYRIPIAGITAQSQQVTFPVTMRVAPTMTYYNTNNTNTNWYNQSLGADSGASSTVSVGQNNIIIGNAQVVGDLVSNRVYIHATGDSEL